MKNSKHGTRIFSLQHHRKFEKKIESLPKGVASRLGQIMHDIEYYGILPRSKKLVGTLKGFESIRIGDYRVLVEIDLEQQSVLFFDVDHRRKIYD